MSDDAFTWMNENSREGSPTMNRTVGRRHAANHATGASRSADTMDELRARLAELQARLDALEGNVDTWQAVAGWLPSPGANMLAAWRQRSPRGTRSERFIRIMDIAGNHLADTSRTAPRLLGRGLRALASTLRERVAA
jgi:hypothetical protein